MKLEKFIADFTALMDRAPEEATVIKEGGLLLMDLVAEDDWLAPEFAEADAISYRQYLLHADPAERFSVVSFVWGPGQGSPIHDHTVWGLIGVLRGGEVSQRFVQQGDAMVKLGPPLQLRPGKVEAVSPRIGDIHQVSNALSDRPSVSIHVYGADIGTVERHSFNERGQPRRFVSGYSNQP
jgi:predicted metal-dependent enzyme (double-stranded beta helix superfamily)